MTSSRLSDDAKEILESMNSSGGCRDYYSSSDSDNFHSTSDEERYYEYNFGYGGVSKATRNAEPTAMDTFYTGKTGKGDIRNCPPCNDPCGSKGGAQVQSSRPVPGSRKLLKKPLSRGVSGGVRATKEPFTQRSIGDDHMPRILIKNKTFPIEDFIRICEKDRTDYSKGSSEMFSKTSDEVMALGGAKARQGGGQLVLEDDDKFEKGGYHNYKHTRNTRKLRRQRYDDSEKGVITKTVDFANDVVEDTGDLVSEGVDTVESAVAEVISKLYV